jgi:hypothetical protein
MFLSAMRQVQQAYEPIRVQVLFDPALIAVLGACRREAAGIPSGSEVIREAVRPFASKPASTGFRRHALAMYVARNG